MITGTKVRIRKKKFDDARNDYQWQTDPELSDLDAVSPLDLPFSLYIKDYRNQLRHPSPIRRNYAVETLDKVHIGNCVYYNIDKTNREAEVGIMIGNRDYWNKGYGTDAMSALVDFIFRHLHFKRLYLKTLEKNIRAQNSFLKCGFKPYGHLERDGYHFLLMELSRNHWEELRAHRQKST